LHTNKKGKGGLISSLGGGESGSRVSNGGLGRGGGDKPKASGKISRKGESVLQ